MNNTTDVEADTCKLSMLWNCCFISDQWHVRTLRQFKSLPWQYAGSVVAIFFVVVVLEGVRRLSRVYDRHILRQHQNRLKSTPSQVKVSEIFRNNRPFKYFGTGYLLMLAAMSHNGGVIMALFAGAFVGYLIFGRDTVAGATVIESTDYGICLEQVEFGKGNNAKV
ncbi:hypothetical protein C8F01DRAFT_1082591 [Mycena amicta]|nr:hypothetical protein C8F01DRAFT_1082591 [Mycena amicta]